MSDIEPAILRAYEIPGWIPDEITPEFLMENRDHPAVVAIIFTGVLATIVVVLRLYGRLFLVKKFGLDDWLCLLSLVLYWVFFALCLVLIHLGSGRHMAYVQYILSNYTQNVTQVLDTVGHYIYAIQLYACRLSGLAFYRRLSHRHHNLLIAINTGAIFITAAFLPQIFLILFHCRPITALWPYAWQPEAALYTCMLWGIVYATNSALSLACDLVLFAIPIALITLLKASASKKLKLSLVLLPGVAVIAISAVRLWLVIRGGWVFQDGAWYYNPMLAVQNAEMAATLLALSVPGLKPLFGSWFRIVGATVKGSAHASMPTDVRGQSTPAVYARGGNASDDSLLKNGHGGIALMEVRGRGG